MRYLLLIILFVSGQLFAESITMANYGSSSGGGTGYGDYKWSAPPMSGQSVGSSDVQREAILNSLPPYISNQQSYQFTPDQNVKATTEGIKVLKALKLRKEEVQKAIEAMDNLESRRSLLQSANDAIKISKDYWLDQNIELAQMASGLASVALDLAIGLTPGVGWARDVYEALTGKDALSQENLTYYARAMAVLGVVTAGYGSNAGKAFGVLSKMVHHEEAMGLAGKIIKESRSLTELRDAVRFLKDLGFSTKRDLTEKISAFLPNSKVRVLTEDLPVYRYYKAQESPARGNWVTTAKVNNPQVDLALFVGPPYDIAEWTIPKGTKVLEGLVASNNGFSGGAKQIFVDRNVLRER